MRIPSVKTLSLVFDDAKKARTIFEMKRTQLLETEAGAARYKACYHAPKTYDIRLHVLNALDDGMHGVESMQSVNDEYADYLNTGDTYAPTIIYWRGNYRVQSIGDFIETLERQHIYFR